MNYNGWPKLSHPGPGWITSQARFTTIARYCSLWARPCPHGFVSRNSRATSQWVTHPGNALAPFSLNFEVPTELEASGLPKGLVLGRDGNIHLRITPLGDVGCHNPPPLGARCLRRHTRSQG
ncbi:hypothetical protein DVH24_041028 [Malus domestica]|uniref:Uncharacterized protein n=1 Tax=Malus domestica TaxID=3750 RepID=A0A498IE83_MALDO|nr:hypothetical protein DVH24_041028 [Malus domestica]